MSPSPWRHQSVDILLVSQARNWTFDGDIAYILPQEKCGGRSWFRLGVALYRFSIVR